MPSNRSRPSNRSFSRGREKGAAALDRRLQAHQEAFNLWRKMISSVHTEKAMDVSYESQQWWNLNCVYLDAKSRKAFRKAFVALANHADYLSSDDSEAVKENWKDLKGAADPILREAELPPLVDEDLDLERPES